MTEEARTVVVPLLLGAVALMLAAYAVWRGLGAQRLVALSLLGLAAVFCLVTLTVTGLLLVKMWNDAGLGSIRVGGVAPTAGVPAPPAAGISTSGDSKDAVANAMTAIGLTVAVVTLILTVGTSWFAEQMQRVARMETQVAKELQRLRAAQDELRLEAQARLRVADALTDAKLALNGWFAKITPPDSAAGHAQDFALWLEMLSAHDHARRFEAFGHLRVLGSSKFSEPIPAAVEDYTHRCHELAVKRLKLRAGDPLHDAELYVLVEEGLWCKVFDRIEQARYLSLTSRA